MDILFLSQEAFIGALIQGLFYAFVALGVYITFRILDFPDLTADGSMPLGAVVAAVLIAAGYNPFFATFMAMVAGAIAGLVTATLSVKFKILNLLASILTMTALYSVNLTIMSGAAQVVIIGRPTIFSYFDAFFTSLNIQQLVLIVIIVVMVIMALWRFLISDWGLAMRATGINPRMARAQGVHTDRQIYLGLAISNALIGLTGAFFAQVFGFSDANAGIGTIVIGLAAVILGEALFRSRSILITLIGCASGSVLYQLAKQYALKLNGYGLEQYHFNLVTALIVVIALILPRLRRGR